MASNPTVRALGRYSLTEPIATGTTATIWRARDTRTGNDVAIKRFHPHLIADRSARKRMEAEGKVARRVRGRTIVSAVDRIEAPDEFALVFPFIDGTPLADRLRDGTPLPPAEATGIAADIADALVAIHRQGLVHRDVKPGNILLDGGGRALLLDFGISRTVADEIEADRALTGAGLAIGTLPYMAPEQLTASEVTAATDVYALGVLLYEMLAGQRPYEAASSVALATEQRLAPARIDAAPAPLVDLALRAMAFDLLGRPTATQFAEGLRSWLSAPLAIDAPTAPLTAVTAAAAVMPSPANSPTWLERHPAFVSPAVALAALLLVALVALAALAPTSVPTQSQPGDAPLVAANEATASPAPAATSTPVPVIPAVVPANHPQPTKPSTTQPAPTPPPAAAPSPPASDKHHHAGGRHHRHGHHHHKHHHH